MTQVHFPWPRGRTSIEIPIEDPGINPNDTYLVFDATLTSSDTLFFDEPIQDPATGETVSSLSWGTGVDSAYHVEAGYDYDGIVRVVMTGQWSEVDPTLANVSEGHRLVLSAGTLTAYRRDGTAIEVPPAPDGSQIQSPLAILGSDLLYGNITDGILMDSVRASPSVVSGPSFSAAATGQRRGLAWNGPGQRVERRHARKAGRDVLSEITHRSDQNTARGRSVSTQRISFGNVRWRNDLTKDAWRAERRRKGPAAPPPPLTVAGPLFDELPTCEADCEGGGGSGGGGGGEGGDGGGTGGGGTGGSAVTPLVWQHGLWGGAGDWNIMRAWVQPEFNDLSVAYGLNSTARAEDQATELIGRMSAAGIDSAVLIGHSFGGLVARRVGQRRPDLVRGVLTVGTPHRGALLALLSQQALTQELTELVNRLGFGCESVDADVGCWVAFHLEQELVIGFALKYALAEVWPATLDLRPIDRTANPFIQNLNATPEYFTRAGIQSFAHRRWAIVRQFFDWVCTEDMCGRPAVTLTHIGYAHLWACTLNAVITGNAPAFNLCTYVRRAMDAVDNFWTRVTTTPNDQTDGIVQGSSQIYPGAVDQFRIFGGDSHAGEPKSDKVRDRMVPALRNLFNVH